MSCLQTILRFIIACHLCSFIISLEQRSGKVFLHRPSNILLLMADDLGWADVAFSPYHNEPDVPETPNLDKLAHDSLVLDNLYSQASCTPTRGSVMTGKYAYRLGKQFSSFIMTSTDERGPSIKFLSEELLEYDYKVHGVGKWHLGHQEGSLPTQKGFDSFYGIYYGMGSYFDHKGVRHTHKDGTWLHNLGNHDFHYDHKNGSTSTFTETDDDIGIHSTELFTKAAVKRIKEHDTGMPLFLYVAYTAPHSPLEPDESIAAKRNEHINDLERRRYAALVTQMDNGIGEILEALEEQNMRNDTIVIFLSDNGAALVKSCWDYVGGSNKPYRDGKFTYFEGGIKSPALIWTPWLNADLRGTHSKALLHVVDIYALIKLLAENNQGATVSGLFQRNQTESVDGGNYLYKTLHGDHSGRETILHNLVLPRNPGEKAPKYCSPTTGQPDNYGVIRHHQHKLFYGDLEKWCKSDLLTEPCPELVFVNGSAAMLFDLESDPYERVNVAADRLDVVWQLVSMIKEYAKTAPTQWVV